MASAATAVVDRARRSRVSGARDDPDRPARAAAAARRATPTGVRPLRRRSRRHAVPRMADAPHRSPRRRLFLACCDAEWRQTGVGPYLIQSRENGELLGSTGLRLASPQQAATGYLLARDAWGQGYATEALRAMRDLALRLGRPSSHGRVPSRASRILARDGEVRLHARGHPARRMRSFPISPRASRPTWCVTPSVFDTGWQPLVI